MRTPGPPIPVRTLPAHHAEAPADLPVVELRMSAHDRRRVRRLIEAPDGAVLALELATGTVLHPGQLLHHDADAAYVIAAADEDVLVVHPRDIAEAARVAHMIGNLHRDIHVDGPNIIVSRQNEDAQSRALHGLSRALLNNMVKGVSDGFIKKLEINGVGFKAAVTGKTITMTLGYSHPIIYTIPDQIKVTVEENTKISIEGPDKQLVGKVASELRSYYPPEPYKGKGVKYSDEKITRKEGKTVQ